MRVLNNLKNKLQLIKTNKELNKLVEQQNFVIHNQKVLIAELQRKLKKLKNT